MTNNFRFPGQYFDAETGLNYNYQRTYDPITGRYTQNDPLGLNGGLNPFGYVEADPILYVDALGLVDYVGLGTSGVSFVGGATQVVFGLGAMLSTSVASGGLATPFTFYTGTAIAAHGLYDMANASVGIMNALNETNKSGIAGQLGEALGGEQGAKIGNALDQYLSINGAMKASREFGITAIAGYIETLRSFGGQHQPCPEGK